MPRSMTIIERPWCGSSLVRTAGFEFDDLEAGKLRKAPPILRPLIQGIASPI